MMYRTTNNNPLPLIIGVLFFILLMVGFYYLIKGLYAIMLFVAPVLAVIIAVIRYQVYIDYFNWLQRKYKRDILSGITWTVVSIIGFPFLLFFLLFRALTYRAIEKQKKDYFNRYESRESIETEYQEYEIIDEEEN